MFNLAYIRGKNLSNKNERTLESVLWGWTKGEEKFSPTRREMLHRTVKWVAKGFYALGEFRRGMKASPTLKGDQ